MASIRGYAIARAVAAVTTTSTITEDVKTAVSNALVAREVELGDAVVTARGYDAAFTEIARLTLSLGAATTPQE
jgi:hypothetical protein